MQVPKVNSIQSNIVTDIYAFVALNYIWPIGMDY